MTLQRGDRERLPMRRKAPSVKAEIDGHSVYLRAGEYPDGRLGEIFLTIGKHGLAQIDAASALDAFAIVFSLALQHGAPLESLIHPFVWTKSDPSGIVVGHDRIRMTSSLYDYIARHLGIDYLDREDLASV